MKVRINETDMSGKPIHDSGEVLEGQNYLEIVDGMKLSPFTVSLDPLAYMRDVLDRAGQTGLVLPDEPEAAAQAFLLKLAAMGFAQFIEDDPYPPRLMDVLEAIRQSGKTNMFDVPMVVKLALDMDEPEVADWVNSHHRDYAEMIFHGRAKPENTEVKLCAE